MKALALAFGAALVATSAIASTVGLWPSLLSAADRVPGSDVTLHFLFAGAAGFLVTWAYAPRGVRRGWRALRPALIVAGIAILDEWTQRWVVSRSFSWVDLTANLLGIASFAFLALRIRAGVAPAPDPG